MNNEPVAWMDEHENVIFEKNWAYPIPLYTHPVKEQKCIVKNCENHKHEGSFVGDLCKPCHQFITTGEGIYSQAYRNTHPVKELTDEERLDFTKAYFNIHPDAHLSEQFKIKLYELNDFARAILRKAQEK